MNIPWEVERAGPEAIRVFKESISSGATEKFATMCAVRIAPGTKGSDRAFMEGRMNNQQLDDMPEIMARRMARDAKAAGINISGKHYVGGIADGRAWKDPEAWVSNNDDVKKVAEKRNLSVSGSVNHNGRQVSPERKQLSETIIRKEMKNEKKLHPKADKKELRQRVINKHSLKRKLD
jgi:hypothetical protein